MLTRSLPRCWVKAKTLPLDMEADLTATHGKVGQGGSSEVAALAGALNKLSMRVHQAEKKGSPVTDKEMIHVLANLDITPGLPAGEEAIEAAEVWATVEDQRDVIEAMQLDAVDEMTEAPEGTHVNKVNAEEIEDSDDDTTVARGWCPPGLRGTFVALRFSGERSAGVRQWRCLLLSAEGQDVVHQSACL